MTEDGFSADLESIRSRLVPAPRPERPMGTLLAAALFAVSALTFAAAAVLAPPNELTHTARQSQD